MNCILYDHEIYSFTNWKIKNYLPGEHVLYCKVLFGRRISTAKIAKVLDIE